jgi:hypothetical protein
VQICTLIQAAFAEEEAKRFYDYNVKEGFTIMSSEQPTGTPNTETPDTNRPLFDAATIFNELFSDAEVAAGSSTGCA